MTSATLRNAAREVRVALRKNHPCHDDLRHRRGRRGHRYAASAAYSTTVGEDGTPAGHGEV
jgi:hypothetical protein